MKSTNQSVLLAPSPLFANQPLFEMRAMYLKTLQTDRVHLVSLAAELARCKRDTNGLLMQIRLIAHRMHGAAAIFDVPTIATAAAALENTAWAAVTRRARGRDAEVNCALETLVDCLARTAGSNTA